MAKRWTLAAGAHDSGHDHRVRDGQFLFSGHNVFGRTWYTGKLDGLFGPLMAQAAKEAQHDLGYGSPSPTYGSSMRAFLLGDEPLTPAMKARAAKRHERRYIHPTRPAGTLIGFPGQGTHSYREPPNNWESDNAWDIHVPEGSDLLAVADGTIKPTEFGPLDSRNPRFAGERLHLIVPANEFYYAHAIELIAKPGQKVKQGDVIGLSGSANGVEHLHFAVEKLLPWSAFA